MSTGPSYNEKILAASTSHYCTVCNHPKGYESPERGCTMPLTASGFPVTSTEEIARSCGCHHQQHIKVVDDALNTKAAIGLGLDISTEDLADLAEAAILAVAPMIQAETVAEAQRALTKTLADLQAMQAKG